MNCNCDRKLAACSCSRNCQRGCSSYNCECPPPQYATAAPAPGSEQPLAPVMNPADANPNSPHNVALKAIDGIISAIPKVDEQIGVLMMALVLAVRRLLISQAVFDKPRRLKVIREAVRQFDLRLRKYVWGK